jgi:hypothetical protein
MALSPETQTAIDRLGDNQKGCLTALTRHGGYPGSWHWGSRSQTIKILDSLVARGVAVRDDHRYVALPEIIADYYEQEAAKAAERARVRAEQDAVEARRKAESDSYAGALARLRTLHLGEFEALLADERSLRDLPAVEDAQV